MIEIIRASIRMMTPILLMAMGGAWTLQTGILNIGQEGGMLLGAFFAALGSHVFASWIAGVLCGILAALAYNLLFAIFCVNLRANIWVVGMTLNIFADSLSLLLLKSLFHVKGSFSTPRMEQVPDLALEWLPESLRVLLGGHSLLVWVTLFLLIVILFVDRRTVLGLRLKAAGENEEALTAAGVPVTRVRYFTLAVNGILVGLAGSFLSISYLNLFNKGMSGGRGWMAVAAVIFGEGRLLPTVLAAAGFGLAQSLGNVLQTRGLESHFALMLPYLCIIAALTWKAIRKRRRLSLKGDA